MIFILVNAVILTLIALAIWKPATCLGSAIGVFSFEQWAQVQDPYFAQHSSYLNIAQGFIVLIGVMAVTARTWNPLKPFPMIGIYIVGLFVLAFISCLWSVDPSLSFFLYKDAFPYIIAFIFLLPLTITCTDDVRTAIISSLAMGTVVLLMILLGTKLHRWGRSIEVEGGLVTRSGEIRNRATPLAPATLAGHVIVMVCLTNFRKLDRIWYLLLWGVLPLGFYICLRSGTRGQYFAAIIVIVTLFGPGRGIKRIGGLMFGMLMAMGVIAFAWYFLAEFGSSGRWGLSNMIQNYSETRLGASKILMKHWLDSSPIRLFFGLGSSASYSPSILGSFPHILPVEILCQLGIVGFTVFWVIIGMTVASAVRTFRMVMDRPAERGLLICLTGLFAFEFLRSLKEWPMVYHVYLFAFCMMIGRFELLVRRELGRERQRELAWQAARQTPGVAEGELVATPG